MRYLKMPTLQRKLRILLCQISFAIAVECSENRFMHAGQCVSSCPDRYFVWDPKELGATGSQSCRPCHYSCLKCSGPQDYECTDCWGDSLLNTVTENESYCHPRALLIAYRSQQSWYNHLLIVLIGLLVLVLILAVMVIRSHKMAQPRSLHISATNPIGPIGSAKTANGRTNYTPVARGDAEQLMTKIPFHDLTSDDEI